MKLNSGPHSPFRTLARLRRSREQRAADAITKFSGTMTFVGRKRYEQHVRDENGDAA